MYSELIQNIYNYKTDTIADIIGVLYTRLYPVEVGHQRYIPISI